MQMFELRRACVCGCVFACCSTDGGPVCLLPAAPLIPYSNNVLKPRDSENYIGSDNSLLAEDGFE